MTTLVGAACASPSSPHLINDVTTASYCQTAKVGSVRYYSIWVVTAPRSTDITIASLALANANGGVVEVQGYFVQSKDSGQVLGTAPPRPSEARTLGNRTPGAVRVGRGVSIALAVVLKFVGLGRRSFPYMAVTFRAKGATYEQDVKVPLVLYGDDVSTRDLCRAADTPAPGND